jgi:helicase
LDHVARHALFDLLLAGLDLALREWLLGNPELVVDGTGLLPTSRSIAFTTWRNPLGALEYVNPLDPDDREFFVPRVIEAVTLPALPRERTPRVFPKAEDGPSVGLYLGLKLVSKGSVALFCGRKDTAAKICEDAVAVAARGVELASPAAVSDANEVAKIAALFGRQMGEAAPVSRSAALGIFPHHASVPHGLRLSIEFAMKASLIKFVVCTSTLAQGVNLPIKYLIVTSVNQGKDRILVRDFHNLIGRAGRAGMHTEGSVIFADNAVFDKKGQRRERWRWLGAKELLDAANSEPSASSISEIFEPFVYGRLPGQSVSVDVGHLHRLLFSDDDETLEAWAQNARAIDPNVKARDFIKFLRERARIVHGIASFLLAHLDFETPGLPERAVELAKNTLAHFLADEAQRAQIETLLRDVAEGLLAGAQTGDVRAALRRSPLAPRSVQALRNWLSANLEALIQASPGGGLFVAIMPSMLQHNTHSTISALSDPTIVPQLAQAWVRGDTFAAILAMMSAANVRIGGNGRIPKIEDAVALCEGGFGYEGAMVIATLADLTEGVSEPLRDAFKFLQRQMKAGLALAPALGMYEVGFADREIAKDLGARFVNVVDYGTARAWIRANGQYTREAIAAYPAYFETVLDELLR